MTRQEGRGCLLTELCWSDLSYSPDYARRMCGPGRWLDRRGEVSYYLNSDDVTCPIFYTMLDVCGGLGMAGQKRGGFLMSELCCSDLSYFLNYAGRMCGPGGMAGQ
jgi:hypothetical protein